MSQTGSKLVPIYLLQSTSDGEWRTVSTQSPVGHQSSNTIFNPVRIEAYRKQLRAFADAVEGKSSEIGTGIDGRAGVEACLAMLESSKSGTVVRLRP